MLHSKFVKRLNFTFLRSQNMYKDHGTKSQKENSNPLYLLIFLKVLTNYGLYQIC